MKSCVCPPGSSRTLCRSQTLSSRLRPMMEGPYRTSTGPDGRSPSTRLRATASRCTLRLQALPLRHQLVGAGGALAFAVGLGGREVVVLQVADVLEAGFGQELLRLLGRDVAPVRDVLRRDTVVDREHLCAAFEQRGEHLALVANLQH